MTATIGSTSSRPAPFDFDGDSKTDVVVFNAGTWDIKESSDGTTTSITGFGQTGDIPVPGDWVGTSAIDAAFYRPSTGTWYFRDTNGGAVTSASFGNSSDIPVAGNYDGDSKMDMAVFRPSGGDWHVNGSTSGYSVFHWGIASDVPVPADFDGDGKTDKAIFRPSSGTWYVNRSDGSPYITQAWGNYGDQPVPADYDGDGKADFTVWRPTTGVWYSIKSTTSTYDYKTLGVPGDTAVPSSFIKQIGSQIIGSELAKLRLSPKNATGGTDLYSQNFSWGTSLVGLPGRAGLNAGFGMGYNSLVWIKDATNNAMIFDPDTSNISPGFRFGFPVIEPAYYDSDKAVWAYMMVSPSGGRTEFRQTSVSSTYETADSSYTQLKVRGAYSPNDPVEDITITISSTDGTKLSYSWIAGAYRCSQVKDRNGNYITIYHDSQGLLKKVTDTLGREINVLYDAELYPTSITQTWNADNGQGAATTHTWATFSYTNSSNPPINVNYGSMNVFGPPNGTSLKVLERLTYADSSSTKFEYNSYGQVGKVLNYAPDNHELNYVVTNLNSISGAQTDCPRLSQTRSKIENFNGGAETVVNNTLAPGVQVVDMDGATVAASIIQVSLQNHPTGNITNTYVGSSGWMESLPIRTDDYANGNGLEMKRSSWTKWTQEDPALSYIKNPRAIESKVGDASNLKRTTMEYLMQSGSTTVTQYGLISAVNIYDSNQTTILKRSETDYNLVPTYTGKRIIGLPSESRQFGYENGSLNLVAKVTYGYDEENFSFESNQDISNVIGHDNTAFSASFVAGRGNLSSTTRHDVTGATSPVTSKVRYDIAGSPVAKIDPMNRKVRIGYTDAFNDNASRNSYAYPTTVTDQAGTSLGDTAHTSTVKYRYDIGASVFAKSPAPAGNTQGKTSEREFDSLGRLSKDKINNYGGSYTRYEYPTNGIQSKVFTTIIDTNNNGADTADEVLSESWSDGAGRMLQSRTQLPGSVGGYSGRLIEYDILGQVKRQSVPTEIGSNWNPAGDDYTHGFLWTSQKYDWKGRVVRTIKSDGTDSPTLNNSDVLISYDGCGCAGGQVTTVQAESVPRHDQPAVSARRTQKTYEDILGRSYKAEILNWDNSVYSSVVSTFNGRDQVIQAREYAGSTSSTTFQDTTATYDGHGRLKTKHIPQQDQNASNTYNYNADDSISNVSDARGAVTNYTYNSRRLVEQIVRTMPVGENAVPIDPPNPDPTPTPTPGPTPSPTPSPTPLNLNASVSFSYDNLGKRTSMTDEIGDVEYEYDELGKITAETRRFNDSMPNAPVSGSRFRLQYEYELGGQLKSYTDPFGQQINYVHDELGRLNAVTGSSFGAVTTYADEAKYTAWNGLKVANYSGGLHMEVGYDNQLRVSNMGLRKADNSWLINKNHSYYADGKSSYVQDLTDGRFDRLNTYDNAGRIVKGLSGAEARGGTVVQEDQDVYLPYRQSYTFDTVGHLTQAINLHWGQSAWGGYAFDKTYPYENNRVQTPGWLFDEDGRNTKSVTDDTTTLRTFNAAGQLAKSVTGEANSISFFDGNGAEIKREVRMFNDQTETWSSNPAKYYIRSTVLKGRVVSEVWANGKKNRSYVKGIGNQTAVQSAYYTETSELNESVMFEYSDTLGTSYRTTDKLGNAVASGNGGEGSPIETDPLGGSIGVSSPYIELIEYTPDPQFPDLQPFNVGGSQMQSFGSLYANLGGRIADLPGFGTNWGSFAELYMVQYDESLANARLGYGFITDDQFAAQAYAHAAAQTASGASNGEASGEAGGEGGGWVDESTGEVDLETNTVTVHLDGYFDFSVANYNSSGSVNSQTIRSQTIRPLTQQENKDFDSARERARRAFKDNKKCRDAIASIIKGVAGASFLPDQTITFRDGSSLAMTPVNDFVYDAQKDKSGYLTAYDSVVMSASGISGSDGNGVTFGITNRTMNSRTGFILSAPIRWNKEFFQLSTDARALHVIHEIVHQYASDVEVANFIAGKTKFKDSEKDKGDASVYLNDYLKSVCNLPIQ